MCARSRSSSAPGSSLFEPRCGPPASSCEQAGGRRAEPRARALARPRRAALVSASALGGSIAVDPHAGGGSDAGAAGCPHVARSGSGGEYIHRNTVCVGTLPKAVRCVFSFCRRLCVVSPQKTAFIFSRHAYLERCVCTPNRRTCSKLEDGRQAGFLLRADDAGTAH